MSRNKLHEEDLDGSEGSSEDEPRQLSRNESDTGSINVPMSMLSYATVGMGGGDDEDDFDIEEFREDCWRRISTAAMGGGIHELAQDLDEDELEGEDANRIIVAVRTRPINDREIRLGTRGCVENLADGRNLIIRKFNWNDEPYDMTFAYDHSFSEDSTQDEVMCCHLNSPTPRPMSAMIFAPAILELNNVAGAQFLCPFL